MNTFQRTVNKVANATDDAIITVTSKVSDVMHQRTLNAYDRKITRLSKSRNNLLQLLEAYEPVPYQLTQDAQEVIEDRPERTTDDHDLDDSVAR